jgi:hypothetical protein
MKTKVSDRTDYNEYLTKEQNEELNRELNLTAQEILERDEKNED